MIRNYKLSICMMVKDEEKNLKRCLESLKYLLDKEDVELIIIDTGSKDNTVDIAKGYTSKLYFHEWNGNFSEMRNITISYATGEWIFIIDADETVDNSEMLYETIINKEKDYNSISVSIKNYSQFENEDKYVTIIQPRLFKHDGEFEYQGRVHNQPNFKQPTLSSGITMKHYGYITTDRDLMEKKFERTANMLKEEIKKDPNNIYYQMQLAVSYSMYQDKRNALLQSRKAYEVMHKSKDKRIYGHIYGIYAIAALNEDELNETIEISLEGVKVLPDYLDLYNILGKAFYKKEDVSTSVKYFKKYFEIYNKFSSLPISKDSSISMYHNDERSLYDALLVVSNYYIKNENYESGYKYLKLVDEESKNKIILMVKTLLKLNKLKDLKKYYLKLEKKEDKWTFQRILESEIKNISKIQAENIKKEFIEINDKYSLFNKIMLEENEELAKELLIELNFNEVPEFYSQIFEIIKDETNLLISKLKTINNDNLKEIVNYLINDDRNIEGYFKEDILGKLSEIRENDFQSNRVYMCISLSYLLNKITRIKMGKDEFNNEDLVIFENYLSKGKNYLNYIYDLKKSRIFYKVLSPTEDKFLIVMNLAKESIANKNTIRSIEYIREALKEFPEMAIPLKNYQEKMFIEYN